MSAVLNHCASQGACACNSSNLIWQVSWTIFLGPCVEFGAQNLEIAPEFLQDVWVS
jgi:hypothetical protein